MPEIYSQNATGRAKTKDSSLHRCIDWSFTNAKVSETLWGPHGYHRYPAKFIPQLVRQIIEQYSSPGDLIADTFLGSGTSGVEAMRCNRYFWGIDINPIAVFISRVKCTPLDPVQLDGAWRQLSEKLDDIPRIGRRFLRQEEKD